jgi:hypothetical protein
MGNDMGKRGLIEPLLTLPLNVNFRMQVIVHKAEWLRMVL